ncbi:MAG: hypothetical protein JNK26_00565 [Candidatus Doudnabacteria bacterium]|nr:hypothetical protein [Candidatus Doudnabacteria bacterium]
MGAIEQAVIPLTEGLPDRFGDAHYTPPEKFIGLLQHLRNAIKSSDYALKYGTKVLQGKPNSLTIENGNIKSIFESNLVAIGVKGDLEDDDVMAFVHNLIEISRTEDGRRPDKFLVFPKDKPDLWREWLALLRKLLEIYPFEEGERVKNQVIKQFFNGYFTLVESGTQKTIKDYGLEIISGFKDEEEAFLRVFGTDGLNWLND